MSITRSRESDAHAGPAPWPAAARDVGDEPSHTWKTAGVVRTALLLVVAGALAVALGDRRLGPLTFALVARNPFLLPMASPLHSLLRSTSLCAPSALVTVSAPRKEGAYRVRQWLEIEEQPGYFKGPIFDTRVVIEERRGGRR